jgi:hypothetical protein
MTGHDELMDSVRRARPDERISARTPAAQALLEEILSMQTTRTPEVTVDDAPNVVVRPHRFRRHRLALSGAAAAAFALTLVLTGPGEPGRAEAVEAAITRSSSLLAESGRAQLTDHWEWDSGVVEDGDAMWEFSGDDSSATFTTGTVNGLDKMCMNDHPSCPDEKVINRHVDGKYYLYGPDGPGRFGWFRLVDIESHPHGLGLNPSTLLDELQPAGGFEEVGREDVDGIPTTRLRAKDPEETPVPDLRDSVPGDTVTSLEVWIDGDGLVRRLDIATTQTGPGDPDDTLSLVSYTMSIRFFDLGAPITIEAPTEFEVVGGSGG